jgi:hypothetical protein
MFLTAGILCIVVAGLSSLAVARIKRQRDESKIRTAHYHGGATSPVILFKPRGIAV